MIFKSVCRSIIFALHLELKKIPISTFMLRATESNSTIMKAFRSQHVKWIITVGQIAFVGYSIQWNGKCFRFERGQTFETWELTFDPYEIVEDLRSFVESIQTFWYDINCANHLCNFIWVMSNNLLLSIVNAKSRSSDIEWFLGSGYQIQKNNDFPGLVYPIHSLQVDAVQFGYFGIVRCFSIKPNGTSAHAGSIFNEK